MQIDKAMAVPGTVLLGAIALGMAVLAVHVLIHSFRWVRSAVFPFVGLEVVAGCPATL
jgi:hypothetical protein